MATPTNGKTREPPEKGCTPELLTLTLDWLVKRYGSRSIDDLVYRLGYHLGELERGYVKDETDAMVRKSQ